ncbi:hypothetical protein N431DRAFT_363410 [Stipitochalara longipes BDJ]|nr:hypothetical protein N431DRAFT_363410 [Stipitochalara longipes BDJ]
MLFLGNRNKEDDESEVIVRRKQIEDYRPGYPQFSSLISAHNPYHLCRRFTRIRARLLLLKQDRLSILEEQLDEVDQSETLPIFLGNARRDANQTRKQILAEMETELKEYGSNDATKSCIDELVERNSKILSYQAPKRGDIKSLKNWVENSANLATDETAYLSKPDLLCVEPVSDGPLVLVESVLESVVISFYCLFRKRPQVDLSRDPNVFIFSSPLLKRITRGLIAWIVVVILLVPVIIIKAVDRTAVRLGIIVLAAAAAIMLLAFMTKVKTWEMFLGGATYATVLIVFVPGNTGGAI